MSLQNIFEMAKADRYAADGRAELDKAREADVEDRTYQIGEISQKTGLQKTANGWVKPKSGGASKGEKKASSGANKGTENSDIKNFDTTKLEKMKTEFEEYKKAGRIVPEGAEERYKAVKSELEKRNGGEVSKSPEESFKATKPAGTIEKGKVFVDRFGGDGSLKVDEVGGDGSFSYTITKADGSKSSGKASNEKELRHILSTSGYGEAANDSAPRVLTGDCKVRVRK